MVGDSGTEKTTALRRLKTVLDGQDYAVLYLSESKLTPRHFYNGLLEQLGCETRFYRGDARNLLHHEIEIMRGVGHRKLVVIVDEGHLLSKEMLEEIRFLLNYKMDSENPLALILAGQTELWEKLRLQAYRAILHRVDIQCFLAPYEFSQTKAYIEKQLTYSGHPNAIFSEDAMKAAIAEENTPAEYKEAFQEWIDGRNDAEKSKAAAEKIIPMVEAAKDKCPACATIYEFRDYLIKRSQWIIGGDGASYDIGYGGLDHVIASGEDVNILVLDTEVYSNTGGQSSKATPLGAIAKFAASGKRVRKKDLGMIATTYGYVYVAQIAMGADQAQTLKAIREAEAYHGPSLVIAYAPCINHGLKAGMGKSQAEEAKAVECGYWHLWRFNPALEEEGKNPFSLDSKEPNWEGFQDYLKGEVRFASVMKQYPTEAADLFAACEEMAKKRYASYKRMAAMDWSNEPQE